MEINKKRYILIRKIIKGVIILFWIFAFITPFLILVSTYTNSISVADVYTYICWGPGMAIISPYQSLYWLFFVLFLIGFFLSFGNIKTNYKNRIINRNIGNISGIIILISGIGMSILIQFILIGTGLLDNREVRNGFGIYFPIIISILVFSETFFLNRVKVITEKESFKEEPIKTPEIEISGKIYCQSCGAELLDKTGEFCSKCGSPIK